MFDAKMESIRPRRTLYHWARTGWALRNIRASGKARTVMVMVQARYTKEHGLSRHNQRRIHKTAKVFCLLRLGSRESVEVKDDACQIPKVRIVPHLGCQKQTSARQLNRSEFVSPYQRHPNSKTKVMMEIKNLPLPTTAQILRGQPRTTASWVALVSIPTLMDLATTP